MINFINSWAKGLVFAIVIATIIEMVLPEGNNKKYVKTIIGIYILFVIIYPIISKLTNSNLNIDKTISKTAEQFNKYENSNISIQTNAYIEETYKQKINEDLRNRLSEKNYDINSIELNIEVDNQEKYGEIKNIILNISKSDQGIGNNEMKEKYTINNVKDVEINSVNKKNNNTKKTSKKNITDDEIEQLKNYLNNTYGTETKNIHINE